MSCHRPFCRITSLAAAAVAALVLLTPAPVPPARAQAAQQATLSVSPTSDSAKPPASQTTGAGTVAAVDQANPARQKSLTSKAIEKVKEVAKSAGDILAGCPACRRRAAPNRWDRCRMWRASSPRASRW